MMSAEANPTSFEWIKSWNAVGLASADKIFFYSKFIINHFIREANNQ
jgi:hypothetical protein